MDHLVAMPLCMTHPSLIYQKKNQISCYQHMVMNLDFSMLKGKSFCKKVSRGADKRDNTAISLPIWLQAVSYCSLHVNLKFCDYNFPVHF